MARGWLAYCECCCCFLRVFSLFIRGISCRGVECCLVCSLFVFCNRQPEMSFTTHARARAHTHTHTHTVDIGRGYVEKNK